MDKSTKETVKQFSAKQENKLKNPKGFVTREEVDALIKQLGNNMDIIQQNLIQAVNTMYGQQVFPFQLEIWAIETLLKDKKLITEEGIQKKLDERKKELLEKAKQIKENSEGKLEVVSEEEAKENEKKAIVKAQINKEK